MAPLSLWFSRSNVVRQWLRASPLVAPALAGAALALGTARDAHADPSSTSIEKGYDLGTIQSPRDVAFAGAQTALGGSTTALYGNPAGLPLTRVYHFEGLISISPEARRQSYGGGVVDSSTSRLAGGAGGTWNVQDPDGIHRTWTDVRLALAYPLGDRLSIGATGRYLHTSESAAAGPFGPSLASGGSTDAPIFNGFTFDVGATVVATEGLRIGVVGHNLTNPGTSLAPTTLAGGIGYATETVSVEVDGLADFTTYSSTKGRIMLGGEIFLAGHFPLRAGYRYDDGSKTHALSLGLGYVDRRWSFEVSGRHDVAGELPSSLVCASLRLFYDAVQSGDLDTGSEL